MKELLSTFVGKAMPGGAVFAIAAVGFAGCSSVPQQPVEQVQSATAHRFITTATIDGEAWLVFRERASTDAIARQVPTDAIACQVSPTGHAAAVLTQDGVVRFYDRRGEETRRVTLTGYTPLPADQVQHAQLFVSDDNRVVVTLGRGKTPPFQDIVVPDVSAEPYTYQSWVVSAIDGSHVLGAEPVVQARFFEQGRFAVVVGPNAAAPSSPDDLWRLTWYDSPTEMRWQAVFTDRPWLNDSQRDAPLRASLPGSWPLQFEPEGTFAMMPPDAEAVREQNPGYVERAGSFYKTRYLPPTMDTLMQAVDLNRKQTRGAETALNQFIDDWLTATVSDGMLILPEHQQRCIDELDARMRAVLKARQYEAYAQWRGETSHELRFLMAERRDPRTPPRFALVRLGD